MNITGAVAGLTVEAGCSTGLRGIFSFLAHGTKGHNTSLYSDLSVKNEKEGEERRKRLTL